MSIYALFSLIITLIIVILSFLLRVTGKLRISLPIIYLFIAAISTFFTDWTRNNEKLVMIGFYVLVAFSILNWLATMIRYLQEVKAEKLFMEDARWQILRAKEMGITSFQFDKRGNLLHPDTNQPILF